ncbi:MAG: hypothetical protein INQ03_14585 [Candidatus Heimdallarchaeota archaeon]|nr:hypothetical protein [Candidatus Heimdallarchaeota archaeon]
MSDKKIDEVEALFLKSTKPKLEIDEIEPISSIGVLYDGTQQGKEAIKIATLYAKKYHLPLKVITTDDYFDSYKNLATTTSEKMQGLIDYVDHYTKEEGVASETQMIIGDRVERIIDIIEQTPKEEDKLSSKLVKLFEDFNFDILVTGAPLFRIEKEESYFGFYLTKLLSDAEIKSNFLIVSDAPPDRTNTILSFVSVDQQPNSIIALTRRSLSVANAQNEIKLVGVVEDKIIETVARADLTDEQTDEDMDLLGVRDRLKAKMEDILSSIQIDDKVQFKSFEYQVRTGVMSSIIKESLDHDKPALVLVRSVSRLDQYLDPVAEQITLTVLNSGYPVLLVWN